MGAGLCQKRRLRGPGPLVRRGRGPSPQQGARHVPATRRGAAAGAGAALLPHPMRYGLCPGAARGRRRGRARGLGLFRRGGCRAEERGRGGSSQGLALRLWRDGAAAVDFWGSCHRSFAERRLGSAPALAVIEGGPMIFNRLVTLAVAVAALACAGPAGAQTIYPLTRAEILAGS